MKICLKRIPTPIYRKILEVMPIPCVDVAVVCGKKFLLGKRVNRPAKDTWWFVGGRVAKGERLGEAVRRHVKAETGISRMKINGLLTVEETMFEDSAQGPASHTINSVFLVEVPSLSFSLGDGDNSNLEWFSKIDRRWPVAVKRPLRLAGFR